MSEISFRREGADRAEQQNKAVDAAELRRRLEDANLASPEADVEKTEKQAAQPGGLPVKGTFVTVGNKTGEVLGYDAQTGNARLKFEGQGEIEVDPRELQGMGL